MLYRLSKIIPVRFASTYGAEVREVDIAAGGHGNHFRSETHFDAESATWWQWRGKIMRRRTIRICLP